MNESMPVSVLGHGSTGSMMLQSTGDPRETSSPFIRSAAAHAKCACFVMVHLSNCESQALVSAHIRVVLVVVVASSILCASILQHHAVHNE